MIVRFQTERTEYIRKQTIETKMQKKKQNRIVESDCVKNKLIQLTRNSIDRFNFPFWVNSYFSTKKNL